MELSILVPVVSVDARIVECLGSILAQIDDGTEVLVLSQAAPDADDARVRWLRPPAGSLAAACNAGLDAATGDYVMFVDANHALAEAAIPAIQQRLSEADADLLFFDSARITPDGTVKHRPKPLVDLPDGGDRDAYLRLPRVAWNKVYRRRMLDQLGLRVGSDAYNDVAWSYACVIAARRVATLPAVCYHDRPVAKGAVQRPHEVIAGYHELLAFIDSHPQLAQWRERLRPRLTREVVALLAKADGGSRQEHRRLFGAAASLLRSVGSSDSDNLELTLLRRDAYLLHRALGATQRVRQGATRQTRSLQRRFRRRRKRMGKQLNRWLYRLALAMPPDDRLAVFAAYWYRGYSCNPAAIYESMRELAPQLRGVWVVKPEGVANLPPHVQHVQPGTARYYWTIGRAKYLINNANFPNDVVKRAGSIHVQTQHGTPLKAMGLDLQRKGERSKNLDLDKLKQRVARWDFNLSQNHFSTVVWARCMPGAYEPLEYGYPRNDVLVQATQGDVGRIREELGVGEGTTVVLYAPTFRDYPDGHSGSFNVARLCRALPPNHVLWLRSHYFDAETESFEDLAAAGLLRDVSAHPDVAQLCLAADVLITDYSSIQFDFANLDRPIVIYADDWDRYREDRGVNFDLLASPPGAVARNDEELIDVFTRLAYDTPETRQLLREYRWRFCEFDDGHAAERVVRRVFLGEEVPPPSSLREREASSTTGSTAA